MQAHTKTKKAFMWFDNFQDSYYTTYDSLVNHSQKVTIIFPS